MSHRRKNSLHRTVRSAYNQDTLARVCTLPEAEFGRAYGMQTIKIPQEHVRAPYYHNDAPADYYHFKDNGASVLAVAHLDTVVRPECRTPHFSTTQHGPLVVCGALDDRLGAYVILNLLPALGITCDWLLTVGEEDCQSTAGSFTPPAGKSYHHVIEFDRGGTDVVMYQYDDETIRDLVQASGARVGHGSFSDIAVLEQLGVKALNWGVGYEGNYHSEKGYAYLTSTFAMVAQYLRFHAQNAGTPLLHQPRGFASSYGGSDYYRSSAPLEKCLICARRAVDPDTDVCDDCGGCQLCEMNYLSCQCYTRHTLSGKPVTYVNRNGYDLTDEEDENNLDNEDNENDEDECRHDDYTTCGCNNGLQGTRHLPTDAEWLATRTGGTTAADDDTMPALTLAEWQAKQTGNTVTKPTP